jgi:recombination protein RecT
LEKSLGFAALVAYGGDVQFQIMYKGMIQLAQRSGQYKKMNVTEVYDDEIEGADILWGDVTIVPQKDGWREKALKGNADAEKHIAGYAAAFRLLNGFEKIVYWTIGEIDAHGKKFSKSYSFAGSPWNTNRPAMRAKTVLRDLFKWGPMSTEMQKAQRLDLSKGGDLDLQTVEGDETFLPEEPVAVAAPVAEEKKPEVAAGGTGDGNPQGLF